MRSGDSSKPLDERARRFAQRYRGKGTGSQAARDAGYQGDARTIAVTAHRLANDPRVIAEMERIRAAAAHARAGELPPPAPAPRLPRLHPMHRAFVEAWVECGVYAEAAARAGYAGGGTRLRRKGAELARRADVAAHLELARARREAAAIADRNELEAILSEIARDGDLRPRDRIAAVRELAKIQGHAGPGLGAFRATGGATLPQPPAGSTGAAIVVWRGNGRGPPPEEL